MISTDLDLFNEIHEYYGHSKGWIIELAKELQVPYNTAAHLVHEAGYYRHKATKLVEFGDFKNKPYAKHVIEMKQLQEV